MKQRIARLFSILLHPAVVMIVGAATGMACGVVFQLTVNGPV